MMLYDEQDVLVIEDYCLCRRSSVCKGIIGSDDIAAQRTMEKLMTTPLAVDIL